MRAKTVGFGIAALFVSLTYGQNAVEPSVDRVLYFTNMESREAIQEIVNSIRAITEIAAVPDIAQRTFTLRGTARQIELAEWLFDELDKPAKRPPQQTPNSARYNYHSPNGKDEIVRLFYFTDMVSARRIQETVNTIRAIAELVRVMPVNEQRAVVLRGDLDRMGLAEWLFNELEKPANAQPSAPLDAERHEYRFQTGSDHNDDVARVFYLAHTGNPQDLERIISTIRTMAKITRLMPASEQNALVLRATGVQIVEAEQLVQRFNSAYSH